MRRLAGGLAVLALAVAACGGGTESDLTTTATVPGDRVRFTLEAAAGTPVNAMQKAAEVLGQRLDAIDLLEHEIRVAGDMVIVDVGMPLGADIEAITSLLVTAGQLAFRPVLDVSQYGVSPLILDYYEYEQSTTTTTAAGGSTTTATSATATTTTLPPDLTKVLPEGISLCDPEQDLAEQPGCVDGDPNSATFGMTLSDDTAKEAWLADPETGETFHLAPAAVLGSDLADAQAGYSQGGSAGTGVPFGVATGGVGQWVVFLDFNSAGAVKFQEVTKELASYSVGDPRRRFAIVLDREVQSAPQMSEEITPEEGIAGGRAVITMGTENAEQAARDLAVVLRYGALPMALTLVRVETLTGD